MTEFPPFGYHVIENGTGGPFIYQGTLGGNDDSALVAALLRRLTGDAPFRLVTFEVDNWNDGFSPWPAPAVYGKQSFGGEGARTLQWLTRDCIPRVEQGSAPAPRYMAGYSLAGLFALWAFCESRLFGGVAACSGSLWFPGWLAYLQSASIPAGSRLYLSLGDREEQAKNPTLATVGSATRESFALIEKSARATLEWNKGGHFDEPAQRVARGMAWLINP